METLRQVWMSYVAQKNTRETDAMPQVLHHVGVRVVRAGVEMEEKVELLAADPQDAMEKVRAMSDDEYDNLKRVPLDQWQHATPLDGDNPGGFLH